MGFKEFKLSGLLTALIILSIVLVGHAQSEQSALQNDLSAHLNYLHKAKSFSGEILVARDSEIIFHDAIGMASRELNIPMEINTKFHIASITKTFTGALLSIAKSEGRLTFENKAIDFIPKLSSAFDGITLHQLLTLTSGLPHNEAIADYWQTKSRLQLSSSEMIKEINGLKLVSQPGEKFSYSSLGYYVLSIILEKIYEKNYQMILDEKILKPLKLANTGSTNTLEIIPQMVNGYHLLPSDSLVKAPYRNYSMLKGAGDLYSSAKDLMLWNQGFLHTSRLTTSDQSKVFDFKNETESYGYGWYIDQTNHKKYYHGGGTWGFSSHNAYYPEERMSIIILSNISTLPVSSIAAQLEKIVFGEAVDIPKINENEEKPELPLAKYAGSYLSSSGQIQFNIVLQKQQLFAQLQGNPPFLITAIGGNRFLGKKIDIELEFTAVNGQITGIVAERMGRKFEFKKQ